MSGLRELWSKIKAGEIPTYVIALVIALLFVWCVITAVAANISADAQSGQLEAFFILIGQTERGRLMADALHPAYLLGGWMWAVASLWGVPIFIAGLKIGWWKLPDFGGGGGGENESDEI